MFGSENNGIPTRSLALLAVIALAGAFAGCGLNEARVMEMRQGSDGDRRHKDVATLLTELEREPRDPRLFALIMDTAVHLIQQPSLSADDEQQQRLTAQLITIHSAAPQRHASRWQRDGLSVAATAERLRALALNHLLRVDAESFVDVALQVIAQGANDELELAAVDGLRQRAGGTTAPELTPGQRQEVLASILPRHLERSNKGHELGRQYAGLVARCADLNTLAAVLAESTHGREQTALLGLAQRRLRHLLDHEQPIHASAVTRIVDQAQDFLRSPESSDQLRQQALTLLFDCVSDAWLEILIEGMDSDPQALPALLKHHGLLAIVDRHGAQWQAMPINGRRVLRSRQPLEPGFSQRFTTALGQQLNGGLGAVASEQRQAVLEQAILREPGTVIPVVIAGLRRPGHGEFASNRLLAAARSALHDGSEDDHGELREAVLSFIAMSHRLPNGTALRRQALAIFHGDMERLGPSLAAASSAAVVGAGDNSELLYAALVDHLGILHQLAAAGHTIDSSTALRGLSPLLADRAWNRLRRAITILADLDHRGLLAVLRSSLDDGSIHDRAAVEALRWLEALSQQHAATMTGDDREQLRRTFMRWVASNHDRVSLSALRGALRLAIYDPQALSKTLRDGQQRWPWLATVSASDGENR